ncbi:rect protein [Novosphingobium sp. FSY-8]|uniref:Rect protein n=1 Tax=Novosphingobium ovatum TaxID=1908523 RepID=A0ABW9XFP6_9SPHN|nr:recombinase RecT [Novosphingobium ovatum]NBC37331.1 rect protein [Novosphingobium ovatum]
MASQPNNPVAVIKDSVAKLAPEFRAALPPHIPVEKFVRVAQTAILTSPDLQNADRGSLFAACTKLAQDGLLPDGREAALVIFNAKQGNGWTKKVQAMPMIAGVLKKIRQSGEVASIDCHVVHQNDKFTYRPGIDMQPVFEPDWFGNRGEPIGAYAIAVLKSGEIVPPEIMNVEQIERVRNVSRAKDSGPWKDWWSEMARKTVMRRYAKRLPSSTDLEDQIFAKDPTMDTRPELVTVQVEAPQAEAPRLSRLEALESEVIEDAETTEAEAEPEYGRADADHGDQFDGAEDEPAYAALVRRLLGGIEAAKNPAYLKVIDDEFVQHRAGLPDDVAAQIDAALTAKRKAMS